MKRLKFKKPFNGFTNAIKLVPESYKIEGNEFEMTDLNETYRMKWSNGKASIVQASDKTMMTEDFTRLKELMNYKPEETQGILKGSARVDENTTFFKSLIKENKNEEGNPDNQEDYEQASREVEYGIKPELDECEDKIEEGEKPSESLSKKEKSNIVKKAKAGEDIGKPGKNFEKVATKAAKEYGSKEAGEKVAAAAMFKNAKK